MWRLRWTASVLLLIAASAAANDLDAARRSIEAGRYAEAEAMLEEIVSREPSSARAWSLLGRARALDRRFRVAEPAFERARELGAADLSTLLLYGSTLWENGRLEAAERVLEEATRAGGDAWAARHQLASLWLWQGRASDAVPLLEAIVEARPEWWGVHLDLARAYQGRGDWADARARFEAYLAQVPRDPGARYGLAMVLREEGELEAAAQEAALAAEMRRAEQELTLVQGRREAELAEAVHRLQQGDTRGAREQLSRLSPTVEVLDVWSRALLAEGDLGGAIERLEEAIGIDPSRRDLRARLRELYLRREGSA